MKYEAASPCAVLLIDGFLRLWCVQLFFLLICHGTLERCLDPSDAVRVEIETAFSSGCVVVPVLFFVATTTDDRIRPTWLNAKPKGCKAIDHQSAVAMWRRIFANQGDAQQRTRGSCRRTRRQNQTGRESSLLSITLLFVRVCCGVRVLCCSSVFPFGEPLSTRDPPYALAHPRLRQWLVSWPA